MKLTASPHFPEKRIGYLGMMLLLSEDADVLMLATNALKNDLTSDNRFVAGLALCCIGNLATADMSRDLAPEVDKHMKSPLAYLRKKACLAMARCLTKCPEMVEDFVDRLVSMLKDKSHGVLVCVVQLMTQVLIIDYKNAEQEGLDPLETDCRAAFLKLVPSLVKMLRNLIGSGYAPEHDVGGISDPFLQVQILILLRLLGANNLSACEEMNDVLAQVATNTETSKNAGNAILYECVQTIMGTESEDGLRVLAVNILGRFLLNRDNNIRYVALNTLSKCIVDQKQTNRGEDSIIASSADAENANNAMAALQRHRSTVVDCLKDPDISIRQRALELMYHLVNDSNVESLTAELLNYLVLCPREHRADICTRILKVVDRYSPNDRWRVDTLITTLTIAGRESTRDVQNATVVYISRADADIHAFATHKLLKAIRDDDGSQSGLLAVGIWCIGEYGDVLLQPYSYHGGNGAASGANGGLVDFASTSNGDGGSGSVSFMALDPTSIINIVEQVTKRHSCQEFIKQRALTAYVKLTQRFAGTGDVSALNLLQKLLDKNKTSHSLELQLRSVEFASVVYASKGLLPPKVEKPKPVAAEPAEQDLFGLTDAMDDTATSSSTNGTVSAGVQNAAKEALTRMPAVDIKVLQKRLQADEIQDGGFAGDSPASSSIRPSRAGAASSGSGGGDLLDIFGGGDAAASVGAGTIAALPTQNGNKETAGKSDLDLLTDIFSAQPITTTTAAPTAYDPFSASTTVGSTPAYDPFSSSLPSQTAPAATVVNPMDLFGTPAMQPSPMMPINDIFGTQPQQHQQLQPIANMMMQQQPTPPLQPVVSDLFGSTPALSSAPGPVSSGGVRVPGLSHGGLIVEFECTKPESWNLQKSVLIAHFKNTSDAPINGMNLQVAVPKHVAMEMEAPSSTTIPEDRNNMGRHVTQKVTVTNSMLGTKNLALKLKIGFTLKGQKYDHLATCSGFPAGEY
jgi:AP-1 complex subunit gamma-1